MDQTKGMKDVKGILKKVVFENQCRDGGILVLPVSPRGGGSVTE